MNGPCTLGGSIVAALRQARLVGSHARRLQPWPGVPLIACAEAVGRNRAVK